MNEILFFALVVGFIAFILFGSKTYTITAKNLTELLKKIPEEDITKTYDFRLGIIVGLIGGKQFNNGIREIISSDKRDIKYKFQINKGTQIRITKSNGKRQLLYFDTMFIKEDNIYGNKSHFAKLPIAPIPTNEILMIELQFRNSKKVKID